MSLPCLIGASAVMLFSIGAAVDGQWKPLPGLKRWTQIDRIPRHRIVARDGVPEPYRSMLNPLSSSATTITRGRAVYAVHCLSCHGSSGKGDGPAGSDGTPAPFDLAWLSEMKISRYDGFMYWTIAEGGAPVDSSMPSFGKTLPADDIWAVTTYIRTNLPGNQTPRR